MKIIKKGTVFHNEKGETLATGWHVKGSLTLFQKVQIWVTCKIKGISIGKAAYGGIITGQPGGVFVAGKWFPAIP